VGAVAWIFPAQHDAHPLGGMFLMGFGWSDRRNDILSYSRDYLENCRGQSEVYSNQAKRGETITHIQNWDFPLNIGYSMVGFLSKILVPYCNISCFIHMA